MDSKPLSKNIQGQQSNRAKNSRSIKTSQSHKRKQNYVTQEQVFGGKFSPPVNPPDVTFQPWYRVTLVDPFSGTLTVKVQTVSDKLKLQLDPTKRGFNQTTSGDSRFIIQIKLSSVQGWNLTGHLISLSVDDYTDTKSATGGRDQLAGIVDTGSPGLLPKVGFKLPASQRNHVLRSDSYETEVELFSMQVGPHDQGLAYYTIDWRFDGSTTLPTSKNLFELLTNCYLKFDSIEAHTIVNERNTRSIAQTTIDIHQDMPTKDSDESHHYKVINDEPQHSRPSQFVDVTAILDRLSILENKIQPSMSSFSSLNDI